MKLTTGINVLSSRNVEKSLSKKILLANTSDKTIDKKALKNAKSSPADPVFFTNSESSSMLFNPDIRYKTAFGYSPLDSINYRNNLLVFAENNEIKKAVDIIANEIAIMDSDVKKYPVYPEMNQTLIPEDKLNIGNAIQEYLDNVFYPKLFQFYRFKNDGLIKTIREFVITGKLGFEIIYDNIKNPKDIIGIVEIDTSTLQKFKQGDFIYYVQRSVANNNKERILHENQVILVEWNEYDYGFVSYVDKLRTSFNIMRSMQTSKILWFAAKSQVRMHIKLALGDVARGEAIQKLTESKNQYINHFVFDDDGTVKFNGKPNNTGYREFFTAETAASGEPSIEEINTNGPDLTEVDSLQYWEKLYWKSTDIPYDRIDPNSSDSWGFTDVSNLRKIEINFGKLINSFRKLLNDLFIKPIIIQLTLKEVEIGIDLSLLDAIKIRWIAFNEYDKLAELEILQKKVDLATAISQFGEQEDIDGKTRKAIPISWIIKNYLDFTPEQLKSMEVERKLEWQKLGFSETGGEPTDEEPGDDEENTDEENTDEENTDESFDDEENLDDENSEGDDESSIMSFDDKNY